jgi:hypothetical protein
MYQIIVGQRKSIDSIPGFLDSFSNPACLQKIGPTSNKPPHEERYNDDDDKSTGQRNASNSLRITVSDSNAVTTINDAIYWKAVMMGRDKQETLWRSCLQEVFFSIEVQVRVDGVKRNCSLLQPKHLISRIL